MSKTSNIEKIKVGDIMSETQFYTVKGAAKDSIISGERIDVMNDRGFEFSIARSIVEEELVSAHQWDHEEKLTHTQLAELFINSSRLALTVNFNKQVKDKDVRDAIQVLIDDDDMLPNMKKKAVKDIVKNAMGGEERTMVGRHHGTQDDFGRINFVDMEVKRDETKSYDNRYRLVDPRTINYIIVNNVKYITK